MRGFILQPTYRMESGRPVLHLYGKLEDGRSFLCRDRRQVPRFFIEARHADAARALGARVSQPQTPLQTMRGAQVAQVEVHAPQDLGPQSDRLQAEGIPCYEADLRFPARFLIDRQLRGAVEIIPHGQQQQADGVDVVFTDAELLPATLAPRLSVLSLDIETDPRAEQVLSVALYQRGGDGTTTSEVLLLAPPGTEWPAVPDMPELTIRPCPTERELLAALCQRVRELDPDVLLGWNVIDFDLAVLLKLAARHRLPLAMGRGPGETRVNQARSRFGLSRASIPGRVVLDGILMLRGAFVQMEEYSLDHVAQQVLGEGKLLHGPGRAEDILRLFQHDRAGLLRYNITDARLALEIIEKLHLLDLSVARSLLTGMPLDRVSGSIAAFDFLYLGAMHRRGVVAPTLRADEEPAATAGGHVLDPAPGLYRNVLVFDFKSLYPSVIRTFQLDPLTFVPSAEVDRHAGALLYAPSGAAFRREPGILTGLLDELFPMRQAAKAAGDGIKSHAIKILMNSFYGVLGTPACRFHNPELANAITSFGRLVLLFAKGRCEAYGRRVLYGDTDSLFVLSGEEDPAAARALGELLAADINRDLAGHLSSAYRVQSRLELEFEALYLRLLLPLQRGGQGGARKRYAGLVEHRGAARSAIGEEVVFTGMEVVRSDWTPLGRQVQRELYERLFTDRPVETYLREVVRDLRAGRLDELLVYRKALRKDLGAYTQTTPPHVAAARKLAGAPGRQISYVMTRGGPEPAGELHSQVDHEHYVQKQVRPVAEPVLALLGLAFDKVVGDDRQLELF